MISSHAHKVLFKFICLSLALVVLSACQKTPHHKPVSQPQPTTQATEKPQKDIAMAETSMKNNESDSETTSEDSPLELATLPEYTLSEVGTHLSSFELSQEAEYLNCAHVAVTGCQAQTVLNKAQINKDPSICKLLGEGQEMGCKNQIWQALSLLENDVNFCEKITQENTRITCSNNFYLSKALNSRDEKICENIKAQSISITAAIINVPTGAEETNIAPINTPPENIEEDPSPLIENCKEQVKKALEFPLLEVPTEPIADLSNTPADNLTPSEFDPTTEPVQAPENIVDPVDITQEASADDLTPPEFDPTAEPVQAPETIADPVDPTQAPADDLTPTDQP